MTEHIKTHTGDKPHECTVVGCGKKFTTAGNLARHRKIHDGLFNDKADALSPSSSSSSTSNRLVSRRSSESFPQLQARTPPGLCHAASIDFHNPTLQSHIDSHHPTHPSSAISAHLQKRRASLPATLLGAHVRYQPPHHPDAILGNNNDDHLLFDEATIHRAKMDAIRDFETGHNPMNKFHQHHQQPQTSYCQQSTWNMPSQQSCFGNTNNYMKHTRSQSLTHQQLHSHLQAMQQQQPYGFKFMHGANGSPHEGGPQPTDVDFLLQEDDEDNQMKTSPVEMKGLPRPSPWSSSSGYNGGALPQRSFDPEMIPPPLDFDGSFNMNDPFFDENAIIDMLFGGDRNDLPQQQHPTQVEPTVTIFHQEQPTFGGRA
ncbi:hypothetical protein DYB32_000832 [Aphanomyces invadans]|uniref:C2H2-type domain-containing protein n=1 Tax=Aphanomyces invadans TaxID=157072 RepID=A0A3R7AFD8_9STRA|nr:hypothetical protein DYB32_000832 [Aphanomyces invadans]